MGFGPPFCSCISCGYTQWDTMHLSKVTRPQISQLRLAFHASYITIFVNFLFRIFHQACFTHWVTCYQAYSAYSGHRTCKTYGENVRSCERQNHRGVDRVTLQQAGNRHRLAELLVPNQARTNPYDETHQYSNV